MTVKKAIVIGGGIHGITAALALADANVNVTLLEKNKRLLQGTSGATHNRAHMGYHYPRSIETAQECLRGLKCFESKYPQALYYPKKAYYAIAKEGSKTSSAEYAEFCDRMQIPYKSQWPSCEFLARDRVDSSFLVPEPCFNLTVLTQLLEEEAAQKNVTIRTGSLVVKSGRGQDGVHEVVVRSGDTEARLTADIVVNATYAHSGNVLSVSNLKSDRTKYCYHTTEVILVRSNIKNVPAVTVMDGPFVSVMPYAGRDNLYLVYDVDYSVAHRCEGLMYETPKKVESSWRKIVQHKKKYLPFLETLEFVSSLWGSRPIPVDDAASSRRTRIVAHDKSPGFYSILEGKFISSPLVAQELVGMIRRDKRIR